MGARIIRVSCNNCRDGKVLTDPHECPKCEGTGITQGIFGNRICDRCDGHKILYYVEDCPKCKGKEYVEDVKFDEPQEPFDPWSGTQFVDIAQVIEISNKGFPASKGGAFNNVTIALERYSDIYLNYRISTSETR